MATREVEAMYFLLNITLIHPIFLLKKNPIFLYNFCHFRLEIQSNKQ